MKYIDEFRNSAAVQKIAKEIALISIGRDLVFMEVCGTHTMSIARFGIKELLPKNIRLLSGPGCPVCVTPNNYVDHAVAVSRKTNTIVTTFGDMIKVPGSTSSLEKEMADGRDIRIVYSPLDALTIAKENHDKEVVFLSIGFETTVPTIASTLMMAKEQGVENFTVLTANKVVPPALSALLSDGPKLDGFLLPGHVSTIIGADAYKSILENYKIACAIAGFEPTDIMMAIIDLVRQTTQGHPQVSIDYKRVVTKEGNEKAQAAIYEVFETTDAVWRGIGNIPGSGLKLKQSYNNFDAAVKFDVYLEPTVENKACRCGEILKGLIEPNECPLFGKKCTPEEPVGACMVSSEGTCAAYYKYSSPL